MTRAACVTAVLLAWTGAADARMPKPIRKEPAEPREDLPLGEFPGRTTAGGLRYDLYCPHTTDPNPLVVIALDVGEPLERAAPLAHHFARSGLIAVVVEPAPDRASYPARIGAVLDEVLAAKPLEASEPGCTSSGKLGAWGAGRGGVAVAELARTRAAAGTAFGAVVAVFAATAREAIPDMETPLLVIEGVRVPNQSGPSARTLIIPGGGPCDLSPSGDPCRERPEDPAAAGQPPRAPRAQRTSEIHQRSRLFFRAYVDWDGDARAAVHGWESELGVPRPEWVAPARNEFHTLISVPLLAGGTNQDDGGFFYGVRPELVFARIQMRDGDPGPGFGLGLYGELLRRNGQTTAGAGLTFVRYRGGLAYAPSVGVATRTVDNESENAITAGLFLGFRAFTDDLNAADTPIGVRIDTRFAYEGSNDRAVMVSVCLDLPLVGILALGVLGARASP